MFSYVSLEQRVPHDHPVRAIRRMVDRALAELSRQFDALYARRGRPSIPPEQLLRALLLQVLYGIRSERQLMERIRYDLLFRWFVGLGIDEPEWDATVFTKNRDRLLDGEVAEAFFNGVLEEARKRKLLSDEHFTVDGTLIEAWASLKSFQKKKGRPSNRDDDPGNPTVNFHGEKRKNDTHESTTDPESRLFTKSSGQTAKLSYMGHCLMENRNGLVVDARLTLATGTAERDAALEMLEELGGTQRVTLGADKGYDTRGFVELCRELGATPHVAQKKRGSAVDGRTTRHAGYEISQRVRKRVEEIYGWMKTIGLMRKTRHRGSRRVGWTFVFAAAAYNLVRIRNLEIAKA